MHKDTSEGKKGGQLSPVNPSAGYHGSYLSPAILCPRVRRFGSDFPLLIAPMPRRPTREELCKYF